MCSSIVTNVCAQETPYEKKEKELEQKWKTYFLDKGFDKNAAQICLNTCVLLAVEEEIPQEAKQALRMAIRTHNANIQQGYLWGVNVPPMQEEEFMKARKEFLDAKKLKNSIDFKREAEAQARAEAERKARAEREAYEKTDAFQIQRRIKEAFEQWNKKGEFEKEAAYAKRLEAQSQRIFDSISISQIDNIGSMRGDNFKKELSSYNAEDEYFILSLQQGKEQIQCKIPIPLSNAETFKDKDYFDEWCRYLKYDWCFVENNLYPTMIIASARYYANKKDRKYSVPIVQNQTEIEYSFDKLGINNPYLKGYVFKYAEAKIKAEKAEELRKKQEKEKNDYDRVGYLFGNNKDEFEKWYRKGEDVFRSEVWMRYLKYYMGEYGFQPKTVEIIKTIKGISSYTYSKAIDEVLQYHKEMDKEWRKNGQFFTNKIEFYEAYISENYKSILKEKKKSM
jgi:hypothetical protein